jgi:hypothetical protein
LEVSVTVAAGRILCRNGIPSCGEVVLLISFDEEALFFAKTS